MKRSIPFSLLAAFAAAGFAAAEPVYTTPVGYTTANLVPGFNLVGITLHNSIAATGIFDSQTETSLTDSTASFAFDTAKNYIVEVQASSVVTGTIIEAPGSSFTANTINNLTGITSDYLGAYSIRESATIGGIFGSGASCILTKGTLSTADLVYVPDGSGGFDIYYHSADVTFPVPAPGSWQKISGSGNQSTAPINYLDGIYVQIRGSAVELTIAGEVKTKVSSLPAFNGFSYFSSIYPAGTNLGSSGLADFVIKGTTATADLIYMPDGSGGFDIYYHSPDVTFPVPASGSWQKINGSGNQAETPITSGFILQRRGGSINMQFNPPPSLSN